MDEEEVETVAVAIYNTHRKIGLPTWERTSDEHRDWARAQARSAIEAINHFH